jgi:hypothetical protein
MVLVDVRDCFNTVIESDFLACVCHSIPSATIHAWYNFGDNGDRLLAARIHSSSKTLSRRL